MKRSVRGIYIVGVLACGAASLWTVKHFAAHFFTVDSFQFHFSGFFSETQKARIRDFFIHGQSFTTKPLSELTKLVKDQFSSIDGLHILQKASGVRAVHVKSATPVLKVNHNMVLAHNRFLFDYSIFGRDALRMLKQVEFSHIYEKKQNSFFEVESSELIGLLPESLFETGKTIPSCFFNQFNVSCESDAKWWLQDKKQKKFFILFNGEAVPNNQTLLVCAKIKRTLESRSEFSQRCARSWVADVRFDDQIIIFRKLGGR